MSYKIQSFFHINIIQFFVSIILTMENKLPKLFLSTLYISSFTFGGGFVIATFMKKKFVDELHWIDEEEMLDLIAIAQSSPGAVAVNCAIAVGEKIAGFKGMIIATLGTIIPPMFILTIVSYFYNLLIDNVVFSFLLKGMQAGVAAIILDTVLTLANNIIKTKNYLNDLIMVIAFILVFFFDVNIIYIILGALLIGIIIALRRKNDLS